MFAAHLCLLVVIRFNGLLFIFAAAFFSAFYDAAFAAYAFIFIKEVNALQLAHTIVHMHSTARGAGHVQYS
jgi:hypothetical protein